MPVTKKPRLSFAGVKRTQTRRVLTVNVKSAPRSGFARLDPEVIAVDAAKHTPAVVVGSGGEIVDAFFDESPGVGLRRHRASELPDLVVWEKSRAYEGDPRPQDIIDETAGGCLTAGSFRARRIVSMFPDEWAAQTKKPARHERIWKELTRREREAIARGADMTTRAVEDFIAKGVGGGPYTLKVHNLLDAAGLFLYAVGRMKRGAVRA